MTPCGMSLIPIVTQCYAHIQCHIPAILCIKARLMDSAVNTRRKWKKLRHELNFALWKHKTSSKLTVTSPKLSNSSYNI